MIFDDILAQVSKKFQSSKMMNSSTNGFNSNNNNINSNHHSSSVNCVGPNCHSKQINNNNNNKQNNFDNNFSNKMSCTRSSNNNCNNNRTCTGPNCSSSKTCSSQPNSRLIGGGKSFCEGPNCPPSSNRCNSNNNGQRGCCCQNDKQCQARLVNNRNCVGPNCNNGRCGISRSCHACCDCPGNNNGRSCSAQVAQRSVKNCNGNMCSNCLC